MELVSIAITTPPSGQPGLLEIVSNFSFRNEMWVLFIPLALMAIDVISGVIKAWAKKNFKSSVMRAGLAKKAGEILILLMGELLSYGMRLPDIVMNCVSFYIIFMEFVSILENADELGIPIPEFVRTAINNVDHKLQGTSSNTEEATDG